MCDVCNICMYSRAWKEDRKEKGAIAATIERCKDFAQRISTRVLAPTEISKLDTARSSCFFAVQGLRRNRPTTNCTI